MLTFVKNIGTTLTNIYTVPTGKLCNINNIRINNLYPSDWNIQLYLYNKATNMDIALYSFELKSGQLINDSTVYQLAAGDILKAVSNLTTVAVLVIGNEYNA